MTSTPEYDNSHDPELIVVLAANAEVVARDSRVVRENALGDQLLNVLGHGGELRELFSPAQRRMDLRAELAERAMSPLNRYYRVTGLTAGHDEAADQLRALDGVAAAYVRRGVRPAKVDGDPVNRRDLTPRTVEAPDMTSDFTDRQGYLDGVPGGVDARWAWTQPGGRGDGVTIADVEEGWHLSHEDLGPHLAHSLGGTFADDLEHGTAVLGVLNSLDNGFGTTGIAPHATTALASWLGQDHGNSVAAAVLDAADALSAGDILLIELQARGPADAYIPVEWWEDVYMAVLHAVNKDIIVVAAAGNGAQDLDDKGYDKSDGFSPAWSNPFRRKKHDSGSIIVGAGIPPTGLDGLGWGVDRSRCGFSNYGSMVDAQGWGEGVTTCGYGDLQGGTDRNRWYTSAFNGTSSASPIVVGALACVQGILRHASAALLTPRSARQLLRNTGSPQQNGDHTTTKQRIGARPDIPAMAAKALPTLTHTL